MTKSDFIDHVAAKTDLTRAAAARVVDAIFDTASGAISEAVSAAGSLSIPGFGTFSKRTRAARKGRNPRTGEAIEIPERTGIAFHPGRDLQERVGQSSGSRPVYRTVLKTPDSGGLDRDRVRDAVLRAKGSTSAPAKGAAAKDGAAGGRTRVSRSAAGAANQAAKPTASKKSGSSTSRQKPATVRQAAVKKKSSAQVSRKTLNSASKKASQSSKSARSR